MSKRSEYDEAFKAVSFNGIGPEHDTVLPQWSATYYWEDETGRRHEYDTVERLYRQDEESYYKITYEPPTGSFSLKKEKSRQDAIDLLQANKNRFHGQPDLPDTLAAAITAHDV